VPADVPSRRCLTCEFRCPGVCDATPSRALRAACAVGARELASDEELVRHHLQTAGVAASSPCLGVLFERHYRYVVAAICRITGRFDLARDLAQDVFVKALLHIDSFRLDSSLTTWLFAIARNCCYDYAKGSAVRHEVSVDPEDLPSPRVENGGLRMLEIQEARRILLRLLKDARLDETETRAFGLHYAGGVPLDALTDRLRLRNRSGAKAQIVSAKRKLTRAVQRWERLTA
jgi:RNA polymerase sigma-70 factor, ECF subfamily